MSGSTISGKVTNTVTLGSANYPSPLTVAGTGIVTISAYSGIGIYGPAGSGTLINDGTVTGGVGAIGSNFTGGNGGAGVRLLGGTTGTNSGTITGGTGGYGTPDAGSGGVGVYLATGAAFSNLGTIIGGAGGEAEGRLASPGVGGAGVRVDGGTLSNSGAITGGYSHGNNGYAGAGVDLAAGTLINTGTISGGSSPGISGGPRNGLGAGVYLTPGATLRNNGTIIGGGNPEEGSSGIFVRTSVTLDTTGVVIGGVGYLLAGFGIDMYGSGSLDNTGTIIGGAGGGFGGGGVGVYFGNGGTLTNAATIIGGHGLVIPRLGTGAGGSGVAMVQGGVLINTAFISGGIAANSSGAMGGDGVDLTRGTLTNDIGATITGGASYGARGSEYGGGAGAGADLVAGTGTNAGIITGGSGVGLPPSRYGASGGTGVTLTASATVTHGVTLITGAIFTNTGSIGGGLAGYNPFGGHGGTGVAMGSSSSSTLVNSGLITGGNGDDVAPGGTNDLLQDFAVAAGAGVSVAAVDTLINTGTIVGGVGVSVGAGGAFYALVNTTISGGDGVAVATGGTVFNTGTVISGVGVYVADGGTLGTAGTVSGGVYGGVTADAVVFAMSGALVVAPGAAFVGAVVGNASATDTLFMTYYGSRLGTLSGIGTQFTHFSDITVGANASWVLTGANTIEAGVTLTELSSAVLTDTGTLVNDGAIVLDPSTLTVGGLIGSGSNTIEAGSTLDVLGTITAGETIVFGGAGGYLRLGTPDNVAGSITNFAVSETIHLAGISSGSVTYASGHLLFTGGDIPLAITSGDRVTATANGDGTDVTAVVCFCANTLILTPDGERPVQDLSAGDRVTTHRGEHRPIVWVGAGKVLATRGKRSAATPVIVRKGALADNVPHQDLRVTKAHAFWFNGVLIPVEFLINHRLIEWDDRAQEVELYHIELASHDVLVANGAPAESYRDDGNRWLFHNARTGEDLPPFPPCAPVLTGGPVVDAIWRHLLERTGSRPGFALTDDPDLHLVVGGVRLDAAERRGAAYIFHLPARPASVRVVSRAAAPAELGVARDPRVLGVAMRQIVLRQGTRFRVIEAADGRLAEGFYPFEPANGLRWTDGDAALPVGLFDGFDGAAELVLHIGDTTRYPLLGAADWRTAA